jgi:hypothetical protein
MGGQNDPMNPNPLAGAPGALTSQSGTVTMPKPDKAGEGTPNSSQNMPGNPLAAGYTSVPMNKVPTLDQDRHESDRMKASKLQFRRGMT